MGCRPRIYYTDTQKALMWERWQLSIYAATRLYERALRRVLEVSHAPIGRSYAKRTPWNRGPGI